MCYFLTVVIPRSYEATLRQQLPPQLNLDLAPSRNASLAAWLQKDEVAFYLTGGMCSCDLFARAGSSVQNQQAALRQKYQAKGWSAAKMERALSQAGAERESFSGLRGDILALLCRVARQVGRVSVLVHWYSGDIDREAVVVSGRRPYDCREGGDRSAGAMIVENCWFDLIGDQDPPATGTWPAA